MCVARLLGIFFCVLVSLCANSETLVARIKSGVLEKYSFTQLDQEEVIIDDRNLQEIEPEAFVNLKINRLSIMNNPLRTIRQGAFVNVSVNEIYLQDNKILFIEPGSFEDIHPFQGQSIETLSLACNKLVAIIVGVFNGTMFSGLFFDFNRIEFIESGAFSDMHYLRRIDLIGNNLQRIDVGVFQNLASTSVWLDFNGNQINFIEPQAFENTSLLTLALQDNDLGFITKNYFRNTRINILDV